MKSAASVALAGNFAVASSCLFLTVGALFGLQYLCLLEGGSSNSSYKTTFLEITLISISVAVCALVPGIGVIRFKRWARTFILILASLLVLFGLLAILVVALPPTEKEE